MHARCLHLGKSLVAILAERRGQAVVCVAATRDPAHGGVRIGFVQRLDLALELRKDFVIACLLYTSDAADE